MSLPFGSSNKLQRRQTRRPTYCNLLRVHILERRSPRLFAGVEIPRGLPEGRTPRFQGAHQCQSIEAAGKTQQISRNHYFFSKERGRGGALHRTETVEIMISDQSRMSRLPSWALTTRRAKPTTNKLNKVVFMSIVTSEAWKTRFLQYERLRPALSLGCEADLVGGRIDFFGAELEEVSMSAEAFETPPSSHCGPWAIQESDLQTGGVHGHPFAMSKARQCAPSTTPSRSVARSI